MLDSRRQRLYHVPVISDSAVDHVENGDGGELEAVSP
jgi:hypothetical protein